MRQHGNTSPKRKRVNSTVRHVRSSLACASGLYGNQTWRCPTSLSDIISTLAGAGRKERNIGLEEPPTEEELDRLRGNINRNEPELIQAMRSELRVLHYAMSTEKAYVPWVKRFSSYVGSWELEQFNELEIGAFLTSLAVEGNVSASTQNQAQSSLIFFYQCVIGKELGFIDASRVKKPVLVDVWVWGGSNG